METREISVPGYERVVWGVEEASGYHGIVVIHSTALGPAVGGTRYWKYPGEAAALTDGLRLARGMTYKNALAGLPFGGGKSIILRDGTLDREKIFRAHGRLVETCGGKYITGEDVGTSPADMEFVVKETRHVAGLIGKSGDPSPHTARGVFRAMQAAAKFHWGSDNLAGKTVAIQGCGHVGSCLAKELHHAGASMVVTDMDPGRIDRTVKQFGATPVAPERIYSVAADIFAPCALGGILNDETIPLLQVKIVAGAANNQLLAPEHGELLAQRGILYAPDYAANAGGVVNGTSIEMLGLDSERARKKTDAIYDTLLQIFEIAAREKIAASRAADRLAEERLGVAPGV